MVCLRSFPDGRLFAPVRVLLCGVDHVQAEQVFEPCDALFQPSDARRGGIVPAQPARVGPVIPRVGEEPLPGVRLRFVRDQTGPAGGALFDAFAAYDLGGEPGGAEDLGRAAPLMAEGGEQADEKSEEFNRFFNDTANYIPPADGETISQLYERTGDFLREMEGRKDLAEKNILVSTHGAAMTSLLNRIRGNLSTEHFWKDEVPPNCSVTLVEIKDGKAEILKEGMIFYKEKVKKWKTV